VTPSVTALCNTNPSDATDLTTIKIPLRFIWSICSGN